MAQYQVTVDGEILCQRRVRPALTVEQLNQEIRRRERVIRIFPNEESAQRLIGAVLMEIDEAWTTGHRYFDMAEYWDWRKTAIGKEEVVVTFNKAA